MDPKIDYNVPFIQSLPTVNKVPPPIAPIPTDPNRNPEVMDMVTRLRNKPTQVQLDQASKNSDAGFISNFVGNKKTFQGEMTVDDGAFSEVAPGKYVPRYDSYFHGLNNEDLYGQAQGTLSKFGNGITKNTLKALNYTLDGTVGTVVGIGEAISKGSFDAVWDNSFSNFIDEQNKRLDNSLANYITDEEKNMSFLKSMTTANFWANDFAGALAFMGGAVGSEMIWAAATGGSSLALASAKWGLKAGGKALQVARIAEESGKLSKAAKAALAAYSRTVQLNKVAQVANNARFIATSAGFESGVEARGSLDESLANFQEATQISKGRAPTQEEYAQFFPEAVSSANKVFAANMAVVGASNFLQFGKMFGLGTGLVDNANKAIGKKLFGVGLSKAADGTVAAIKATKVQKIAGKVAAFIKNPIVEGWEEGTQSVIGKTSQKLLASKFDPSAMKENYSNIDAIWDSLAETYGTKEGIKEVGIGFLVGMLGNFSKTGGIREYNQQVKNNEKIANNINLANTGFTTTAKKALNKMLLVNQQTAATNAAAQYNKEGMFTEAAQAFDQAQFAKMMADQAGDMLDSHAEDFNLVMDQVSNESLAEEYGVEIEQVKELKQALKEDYLKSLTTFKKAYAAAEALAPTITKNKKGLKEAHFIEEIASNFYLGVKSMERVDALAQSLEQATGISGFADTVKYYSNLGEREKEVVFQLKGVNSRIKNLEQEYVDLQQDYSTLEETAPRIDDNVSHTRRIEANRIKAANVLERKSRLEAEKNGLIEDLKTNPAQKSFDFQNNFRNEFVDADLLVKSLEEVDKLDAYIQNLETRDPNAAEALRYISQEYAKNQKAFESFHDVYSKLTDQRFNYKSYKGVAKLINTKERFEAPKSDKELTEREKQIEDLITQSGLDEYEAFNFRLFAKVSDEVTKGFGPEMTQDDILDPVGAEEWNSFVNNKIVSDDTLMSIAEKVFNKTPLSRREDKINNAFKVEIAQKVKEIKKTRGNNLRSALIKPQMNTNLRTTSDTLRDMINQILNSKNYLQGLSDSDFKAEDVPTEEEYRRINELQTELDNKGKLSKKKQAEYDALKDRMNNWGKIEGTFSGQHSLSGLYNQLFALEKAAPIGSSVQTNGVLVSDTMNGDEIEAIGKKTYYNILQSYDKVFFSRDGDGIHVHNINLNGFLESILPSITVGFVKIDGKKIDLSKTTEFNFRNNVEIEYTDVNNVTKIIAMSRGSRGELIFSPESITNINADTNLVIGVTLTNAKLPTNYFTVLQKVSDGTTVKLEPMSSNFFDPNLTSDVAKIQALRKGTELRMDVDMTDPYNKGLLKEFRKTGDSEEFARNLKIRFIDAEDNLVGVLKAEHANDEFVSNRVHFERMAQIRREAATKVLESPTATTVDLDSTELVQKVFIGHPILDIEETADGKHSVKQNRFTDTTSDSVSDMGYIENGKLVLRNNTSESSLTTSFVHGVMTNKSERYTDVKVPVVVINFNGLNIVYPVSLVSTVKDSTADLDNILNQNLTPSETVVKITELLIANGIDVQSMQIRSDNYNSKLADIKTLLSNLVSFTSMESFVDPNNDQKQMLKYNAMIDIDLAGNMFHSPKVVLDFQESQQDEEMEMEDLEEVDLSGETESTTSNTSSNTTSAPSTSPSSVPPVNSFERNDPKVGDKVEFKTYNGQEETIMYGEILEINENIRTTKDMSIFSVLVRFEDGTEKLIQNYSSKYSTLPFGMKVIPNIPTSEGPKVEMTVAPAEKRNPSFEDLIAFTLPGGRLEIGKVNKANFYGVVELFVDEAERRKGIAAKLLQRALDITSGNLSSMVSNDASIALHYSLGMRAFNDAGNELSLEETKAARISVSWESIRMILPESSRGMNYTSNNVEAADLNVETPSSVDTEAENEKNKKCE